MEFVKFTFPTKEDIGTALYDSVASALGALPDAPLPDAPLPGVSSTDVPPTDGHVYSLYEMGHGMISSFMQMPVPQMGKIPLEEWSASHQTPDGENSTGRMVCVTPDP
jgi:hypothetical protein